MKELWKNREAVGPKLEAKFKTQKARQAARVAISNKKWQRREASGKASK